ncbi:MAG: hypothetical protein WC544_00410 [Patescibacteria group bacterium]
MAKRVIIIIIIVGAGCVLIALLSPHLTINPKNTPTANPQPNLVVAECDRDSDCLVSGCSGTLCVPRDRASQQYSTCEWQPEYACYADDSCLCRAGQCRWAETEAYASCIRQLK